MSKHRVTLVVLLVCLLSSLALGVGHRFGRIPPKRGFYYWKTEWSASPAILRTLSGDRIDRLYMRLFDVEWNERDGAAEPIAPLRFESAPPRGVKIVPVVYITNAVFLKIAYASHVRTLRPSFSDTQYTRRSSARADGSRSSFRNSHPSGRHPRQRAARTLSYNRDL